MLREAGEGGLLELLNRLLLLVVRLRLVRCDSGGSSADERNGRGGRCSNRLLLREAVGVRRSVPRENVMRSDRRSSAHTRSRDSGRHPSLADSIRALTSLLQLPNPLLTSRRRPLRRATQMRKILHRARELPSSGDALEPRLFRACRDALSGKGAAVKRLGNGGGRGEV